MLPKRRKSGKTLRNTALIITSTLFVGAAISPGLAANDLAASFLQMDRGALALLIAFAILFVAIIFEVWRLGHQKQIPALKTNRTTNKQNPHE